LISPHGFLNWRRRRRYNAINSQMKQQESGSVRGLWLFHA
jgi:hypothetical protein